MFENLGWMLLAKRNHNKGSIKCYIKGLKHLQNEIVLKHKETIDPDRRKDLEELKNNVEYLAEHAKTLLS
jgi:hypothetical protein